MAGRTTLREMPTSITAADSAAAFPKCFSPLLVIGASARFQNHTIVSPT